jgi:hypothetical protein
MMSIKIDRDPASYGSKGQTWHPDFVAYMVSIVTHPTYAGMPDAVKPDGKIQWEAPSNRKGGQHQNTHHLRRDWWRAKAQSVGTDMSSETWISDTAKKIHLTGDKPCKRCGRMMRIGYVYPNGGMQSRLRKLAGAGFEVEPFEPIGDTVQRLVDTYGSQILLRLPALLTTGDVRAPNLGQDLDRCKVNLLGGSVSGRRSGSVSERPN